jgi:hypothetical protein
MELKPREEREEIVRDFLLHDGSGNPGTCYGCRSCWYVGVEGEVRVSCSFKSKTQGITYYKTDYGCDNWAACDKLIDRVFAAEAQ